MENAQNLLFECVVAKSMWDAISETCNRDIGHNFENVGSCWLSNKKFLVVNMFSSAALWELWKLRNDFCFQDGRWKGLGILLQKNCWPNEVLADTMPGRQATKARLMFAEAGTDCSASWKGSLGKQRLRWGTDFISARECLQLWPGTSTGQDHGAHGGAP